MSRLHIKKLPRAKGRTLIIGDVHGCLEELETIVDAFAPSSKDRLISVGDLINGGPDSPGVLKFARKNNVYSVLGNHEMRFLRARLRDDTELLRKRDLRTYRQLKRADWEYIGSWPHVIRIPSTNHIIVHGGFHPFKPWRKQNPEEVTTIQVIDNKGRPARRADAPKGKPWGKTWKGPEHIYYGHTPRPEPVVHSMATGLDTGCVYGYCLTAISIPDMEFFQVQAQRAYVDD